MAASNSNLNFVEATTIEFDLCNLLQTLKLEGTHSKQFTESGAQAAPAIPQLIDAQDILMSDDPSYHSDGASDYSSSNSNSSSADLYGCAYLQAIQAGMEGYITTGGEYLEAIFTHREVYAAHPAAHVDCAKGFSDFAQALEQRAWRADREADSEAVAAFRHEAWQIAACRGW